VSASSATASSATPGASAGPSGSSAAVADPSRLKLEGKPIQGAVLFAKVDGKVGRIDFLGHRAVVSDDGEFPIAFFRNAPKNETMKIHFADGAVLEHTFTIDQRTYDTEKIDGFPKNMVLPDAETRKKVKAAEDRIDAVRMKYGKKNCYKDGFAWPLTGKITSHYGVERILNGTDQGIHWGVDVAAPVGAPVKAPACGTVVFVEADIPLSGNTLVIDHGHGLTSTFIHLASFAKKVGDEVKQGEVLATVGMTGRTNGPHLHWAMNYFEIRVDPELLAPAMP
jgi:murein DD-endopeptidase MepM/ murein hydrolase activator NlpD